MCALRSSLQMNVVLDRRFGLPIRILPWSRLVHSPDLIPVIVVHIYDLREHCYLFTHCSVKMTTSGQQQHYN